MIREMRTIPIIAVLFLALAACGDGKDAAAPTEEIPDRPLADGRPVIQGIVTDLEDNRLEGVVVRLKVFIAAGSRGREGLTTKTDRLGWFAFDIEGELDPRLDGPFEISFEKDGFVRRDHRFRTWWPGQGRSLDQRLPPSGHLSGTVVDGAGRPVGDAIVYAIGSDVPGARELVELRHTRTAADGTFLLKSLEAGKHDIGVRADGFLGDLVRDVRVEAHKTTPMSEFALVPGKTIAGRVVLSGGKGPVKKALVRVFKDPILKEYRLFGRGTMTTGGGVARVDEEGRFRVTGLPEGTWEVDAATLGLAPVKPGASGVEAGTEDLELVFDRAAQVLIRVRDVETGKPVPRFRLVISCLSGPKSPDGRPILTETGDFHSPRGEYGFPAREDETYGLEIEVEGYEDARRTVGPLKGLRTNVVLVPMKPRESKPR